MKTERRCIDAAYSVLAVREHSRQELYWKLRRREWCDEAEINGLLDALEADNILSDDRYAESLVRSSLSRGHGRIKIRYKLFATGVATSLIQKHLEDVDINWYSQIHDVRIKKCGETLPNELADKAKLSRFLAGRGFEAEFIRQELEL